VIKALVSYAATCTFGFRKELSMAENEKMICPKCGVEMNFHAEKIVYAAGLAEPEAMDAALGGVVEEFHTCPECGQTLARREVRQS
jgi:ribosomal protein S27AE